MKQAAAPCKMRLNIFPFMKRTSLSLLAGPSYAFKLLGLNPPPQACNLSCQLRLPSEILARVSCMMASRRIQVQSRESNYHTGWRSSSWASSGSQPVSERRAEAPEPCRLKKAPAGTQERSLGRAALTANSPRGEAPESTKLWQTFLPCRQVSGVLAPRFGWATRNQN